MKCGQFEQKSPKNQESIFILVSQEEAKIIYEAVEQHSNQYSKRKAPKLLLDGFSKFLPFN